MQYLQIAFYLRNDISIYARFEYQILISLEFMLQYPVHDLGIYRY